MDINFRFCLLLETRFASNKPIYPKVQSFKCSHARLNLNREIGFGASYALRASVLILPTCYLICTIPAKSAYSALTCQLRSQYRRLNLPRRFFPFVLEHRGSNSPRTWKWRPFCTTLRFEIAKHQKNIFRCRAGFGLWCASIGNCLYGASIFRF